MICRFIRSLCDAFAIAYALVLCCIVALILAPFLMALDSGELKTETEFPKIGDSVRD